MAKSKALNRIKEVLEEKGVTQSWLACEIDVEFRTINRFCNGHREPSLEILFAIAKVLKVNPRELINS